MASPDSRQMMEALFGTKLPEIDPVTGLPVEQNQDREVAPTSAVTGQPTELAQDAQLAEEESREQQRLAEEAQLQADIDAMVEKDGLVDPAQVGSFEQEQAAALAQRQSQRQLPTTRRQGRIAVVNEGGVTQQTNRAFQPFAENFQAQIDTQRNLTEAQIAANQVEQQNAAGVAQFEAEQAKQFEAIQAAHKLDAEKRLDEVRKLADQAANFKIDQSRIWNDGGSFTNAAGILAAGIGGFLSPILGRNEIQSAIDKIVNNDINSQREEKDSLQRRVGQELQFDALARQNANDESEAFLQSRLFRLNSLKADLQAKTLAAQDPILREQGNLAILGVDALAKKDWMALQDKHYARAQRNADKETAALEASRQRAAAAAGQKRELAFRREQAKRKQQAAEAAARAAGDKLGFHKDSGFFSVDEKGNRVPFRARTDKQFETLREVSAAANTGINAIDNILENVNFDRIKNPNSLDHALAKSALTRLVKLGSGKSNLGGQFTDQDFARELDAMAGGKFDGMFRLMKSGETFKKMIRQARNDIILRADQQVRPMGGRFEPIPDPEFRKRGNAALGRGLDESAGGPTDGDLIKQAETAKTAEEVNNAAAQMWDRAKRNEVPISQVKEMINVLRERAKTDRGIGDVLLTKPTGGATKKAAADAAGAQEAVNLADKLEETINRREEVSKFFDTDPTNDPDVVANIAKNRVPTFREAEAQSARDRVFDSAGLSKAQYENLANQGEQHWRRLSDGELSAILMISTVIGDTKIKERASNWIAAKQKNPFFEERASE